MRSKLKILICLLLFFVMVILIFPIVDFFLFFIIPFPTIMEPQQISATQIINKEFTIPKCILFQKNRGVPTAIVQIKKEGNCTDHLCDLPSFKWEVLQNNSVILAGIQKTDRDINQLANLPSGKYLFKANFTEKSQINNKVSITIYENRKRIIDCNH